MESDCAPAEQCGDPSWGSQSTRFLISDNASDNTDRYFDVQCRPRGDGAGSLASRGLTLVTVGSVDLERKRKRGSMDLDPN